MLGLSLLIFTKVEDEYDMKKVKVKEGTAQPPLYTFTMRRRRHDIRPPVQVLNSAEVGEDATPLTITMLGAGQEVGRSCCVIEYRGKKVVCDAGLHPAHPGMGSLPFIDELDWSTVDAMLVTQWVERVNWADDSFHVDHAAALPYVMEKVSLLQA